MIADNDATQKTSQGAEVVGLPQEHPQSTSHQRTALGSTGLERPFRDLTQNRLRRGIFRDVEKLITAIGEYVIRHSVLKPFVWNAKANDILEKVARKALDGPQLIPEE